MDLGGLKKISGFRARRLAGVLRLLSVSVITLLWSSSCIQNDGKPWTPFEHFKLMSLDDERALGMEFDRELGQHFKVIRDPVVTDFVQDLGLQILDGVEPKSFIYRFRVIEAPQLNAFAVPGGYIYFHTGTLMAVTSVDELAVVMAHEVAHVSKRHLAHRRQDRQIPSMLTSAALIAATVASQNAAPLITGMAINVAVDLHYSRGDEAESDRVGAVYASRAGFDPSKGARFFERILAQRHLYVDGIPPYLFSHPAVEDRITDLRERGQTLRPVGAPKPGTREAFIAMQARLALLLDRNRSSLPGEGLTQDHGANDAALEQIESMIDADQGDRALQALTELAIEDPRDPRISFRIGEVLAAEGRIAGAIAAYRRTIELDSSRALVYFRLGEAYRIQGERERAVYAFERVVLLAKPASPLVQRADWEIVKLTFGVIAESGFSDPTGEAIERYPSDAPQMVWWGRVSAPLLPERDKLRVRWRAPSGRLFAQESLEQQGRVRVRSRIDLGTIKEAAEESAGLWAVEVLLNDEVVFRNEIYRAEGRERL